MGLAQSPSLADQIGNVAAWLALVLSLISLWFTYRNTEAAENSSQAAQESAATAREALALNKRSEDREQRRDLETQVDSELNRLSELDTAVAQFSYEVANLSLEFASENLQPEQRIQLSMRYLQSAATFSDVFRQAASDFVGQPEVARTALALLDVLIQFPVKSSELEDVLPAVRGVANKFWESSFEYRKASTALRLQRASELRQRVQ